MAVTDWRGQGGRGTGERRYQGDCGSGGRYGSQKRHWQYKWMERWGGRGPKGVCCVYTLSQVQALRYYCCNSRLHLSDAIKGSSFELSECFVSFPAFIWHRDIIAAAAAATPANPWTFPAALRRSELLRRSVT